jgi:peptidoglycan/xylan/chitin deacetylase (PgdA/CDA1 family)
VEPWVIGVPAVAAAGAGLGAWGAFAPSSPLFGAVLRRLPAEVGVGTSSASSGGESPRRIALTFDDGPNPAITPQLLDLLDRYTARASFFIIGRFAAKCPDLVREIAARGHLLANHTQTHPDLLWLSRARIAEELRQCEDIVAEALAATASPTAISSPLSRKGVDATGGLTMEWMRPPYGFRGPQLQGVTRELGFRGVATWSRICFDWKPHHAEQVISWLARVRARDIVLLHDGDHRALGGDRAHVVAALEHWLPRWRDAGLEFVTIAP